MKRDNFTLPLAFPGELIIDNFAGGGGTSTGLEAAFGRPVDIAINHDPEALAMHAANHPHTLHLCESVWDVNPIQVTGNQPVALVWLSPDCKHFSKAKGGTPVSKHIRGLAWVGMRWVAMCKPRVLMLENVEEFQTWGPILVGPDGQARPDPARRGTTFQSFVRQLKAHGYQVDWRELRASDHGTPTIRKRLFLVARRDGLPIVWPEQTHAEPTDRRVIAGKLAAHRTAAECIDFDLHAESVFGRKRPLVDNTMRRVAKGLWRHVLTSASPFIVGVGGTHHALVGANLVTIGYGEREGQQPRTQDIEAPLGTVVAGGIKSAVAMAHITKFNTGAIGCSMDSPLPTVTAGGTQQRLITAYMVKYYSEGGQDSACSEPMHTVPTKARMGLVQTCQVPAATLAPEHAERARLCAELLHKHLPEHFPDPAELVLMWHAGQWWVLVDITLRMLKPRELFRAQGFPRDYHFERVPDPALLFRGGKQAADPRDVPLIDLSTTAQVRMCGNSVCPPLAEALARANFAHEALIYGVAA